MCWPRRPHTRCFRDPTRGGLASTLNELAEQSGVDFVIEEDAVPVKDAVLRRLRDARLRRDARSPTRARWSVWWPPMRLRRRWPPCGRVPMVTTPPLSGVVTEADPARGPKVFLRTASVAPASWTCSSASSFPVFASSLRTPEPPPEKFSISTCALALSWYLAQ